MTEGLPDRPAAKKSDTTRISNPLFLRSFGDYELLLEVARGGMGIIYKAKQRSLGRIVAIKVLSSGEFASPEFVQRFQAEATAAARLQHPNIVAIHEVGEHDGVRYFSMDFVEGPNLAQLLGGCPLAPERAATYLRTIAEAIQYAHQQGILHRDLKPSNVLLDPFGEPRVTDFGLAKVLTGDSDLTMTGQVLGTPGYLPPEQADSSYGPLTPAADVYSLGAILYFMLTARAPFAAGTLHETLRQVLTCDAVAPSVLNPEVPRDLETICLKCLEREPGRRYASAAALAEDLRRYLEQEPIVARPLSAVGRLNRWCRRRPSLAAVWLLLAALAVGSTASSFWIARARARVESSLVKVRSAEATGREHLREARLAEARAVRHTTIPGRRAQALAALAEAARIRPGSDLRDEALASLMLPDIRALTNWDFHPQQSGDLFFDSAARIAAFEPRNSLGSERGPAELRRWGHDEVFARLSVPGTNQVVGPMRFSADGSLVMARYLDESLRVWHTGDENPFIVLSHRPAPGEEALTDVLNSDYDFNPEGTQLALGLPGKGVSLHRVGDGSELARWSEGEVFNLINFSPDGRHLAATRLMTDVPLHKTVYHVYVLRVPELTLESDLKLAQGAGGLAWSSDSRLLAVASRDRFVTVFDLPERRVMAKLLCPGMGHGELSYVGADSLLALRGTGSTLRFFNPALGREELVLDSYGPSQLTASPGASSFVISSIEGIVTRWQVQPPVGVRVIPSPRQNDYENAFNNCCLAFSPDGQWIATSHGSHLLLRALNSGRLLVEQDFNDPAGLNFSTVAFTEDGRTLLRCSSMAGLVRQSINIDTANQPHCGPATLLDPELGFSMTDHSADGRRLALVNPVAGLVKIVEVDGDRITVRQRWNIPDACCAVLDPAGLTVLINRGGLEPQSATQHLEVRRLSDGAVAAKLMARPYGEGVWSPDGKTVLTSNDMNESVLWDTTDWHRRATLKGSMGGNATTFALSPDGSFAVIARDERIQLVSTRDGALRASIECPAASGLAAGVRFLPDGRRFAVLWRDARVDVIDPEELQAGLKSVGLSW
jgi:serine/threonine protein kinase/WD40 repeat protein